VIPPPPEPVCMECVDIAGVGHESCLPYLSAPRDPHVQCRAEVQRLTDGNPFRTAGRLLELATLNRELVGEARRCLDRLTPHRGTERGIAERLQNFLARMEEILLET